MKWYSYSYSIELDERVRVLPFGRSTSTSTKKLGKTLKIVPENVGKDELAESDLATNGGP